MTYSKRCGPFELFRVVEPRAGKNFLDVSLSKIDNFGWEWGTDSSASNPSTCIRISHFTIFSIERLHTGIMLHFLGFWWMK